VWWHFPGYLVEVVGQRWLQLVGSLFTGLEILRRIYPNWYKPVLSRIRPSWRKYLEKTQQFIVIWILIALIFVAGFFAWDDKRAQVEGRSTVSDTSKLQAELGAATSQLAELRERLAPRQIKDEAELIKALSSSDEKYPLEITVEVDGEAQDYAKNLEHVLKASGWDVIRDYVGWDLPKGVSVADIETHRGAGILAGILRQHGIEVGKSELKAYSPGAITLGVGRKP